MQAKSTELALSQAEDCYSTMRKYTQAIEKGPQKMLKDIPKNFGEAEQNIPEGFSKTTSALIPAPPPPPRYKCCEGGGRLMLGAN